MQKEGLNAPTEDESIVEETSYKCLNICSKSSPVGSAISPGCSQVFRNLHVNDRSWRYFRVDQVMKLNSLYDPDFTGGGHQPYLYDTMTATYANYRVYAASVKIINSTIGGSADLALGAKLGTNSSGTVLSGKSLIQ